MIRSRLWSCVYGITGILFFYGEVVNLTVSQPRLQIFIWYSKNFRRAIVDISTFKGEIRNSYFLLIWQFHNSNCRYSWSIVNTLARMTFGRVLLFNPIQDGLLAHLPKIRHTYPTMMKLGTVIPYLRKIQKCINHVTHPLSSADISIFSSEINKFCYIKKYIYRLEFDR